ncbi:MAG: hypothetical protein QM718_08010 [Steroidobacteraceae bacterium]
MKTMIAARAARIAALGVLVMASGSVLAQGAPPQGGAPRGGADVGPNGPPGANLAKSTANGPPGRPSDKVWNLVGVWSAIESGRPSGGPVPKEGFIKFKPEWEAKRKELARQEAAGEVIAGRNAKCIPTGLPDLYTFGFTITANADYLLVLGGYGTIQPIYLNKKQHTAANLLFPSYQGESIGHWEGNTLVVDVVGLDPGNEITYALPLNDPNTHIVERWTLLDQNRLELVLRIEAPAALYEPWTYRMVYGRRPGSEVVGAITYCDRPSVNNSLDLTPPSDGYVPPGADR